MSVALRECPGIWQVPRKSKWKVIVNQWRLFVMVSPGVILLFIFCYMPMLGIQIAWKDFDFGKGIWGSPWAGWKYFSFMQRNDFWLLIKNTFVIAALKLLFAFPAPIILALLMNQLNNMVFKRIIQTLTYLPHFISWVVVVGIMQALMALEGGVFNTVLVAFGYQPILFLGERNLFYPIVVLSLLWKETGWGTIIYLAAISAIDPQLYDAAEIDGANQWVKTWTITLPALKPIISILLVLSMPSLINAGFEQIWLLQNAYNLDISEVVDTYVLRLGLLNAQFSFATAIGIFTSVIATTLILVANTASKKLGGQGIW